LADVSDIKEPIIPPIDSIAEQEQRTYILRAKRKDQMEGTAHKISIILLWIIVLIIIVVGLCRLVHLILPHCYQWLTPEEITKIDEFFIHGTFGALIVGFLKNKISGK
jgi:hypothetical protein